MGDVDTSISILNHDCLLEIFQNFDLKVLSVVADVCRSFQTAAHHSFRVTHNRRINLPVESEYEVSIETTALVLRHFGRDVKDLRIAFPVDPELNFNLDIYADLRSSTFAEIGRSVGESLDKLCLENLQVFDLITPNINELKGVFAPIKVLKLSTFDRDATPCYLNFRELCPMMEKLKLAGDFILDAAACPHLTNLTIQRNRLLDSDLNDDMLPNFYANNQQLRKIKIKVMNYSNAFLDLEMANMNGLEKLSVECYNLYASDFHLLLQMQNLIVLKLCGVYALDNLEQTLHIISQLSKLKHLEISMTSRYNPTIDENDLLQIALNAKGLERFQIYRGKITANTVVQFIKVAKNLRKFNCFTSGLKIDVELCRKIVETRQQIGVDHPLELNGDCNLEDRAAVRKVHT